MPQITLGQHTIEYIIRESPRARSVRFRIDPKHGLQVVVPAGVEVKNLDAMLRQHEAWILKHIHQAAAQPMKRQFAHGETLPVLGEARRLEIEIKPRGKQSSVALNNDVLHVRLGAGSLPNNQHEIRQLLEGWYRHYAREYIQARVAQLAHQHGFKHGHVTIKAQTTRWGSCSSKGNLNFNWRLIMTPPAAIDYVIIHELCHLRELNHSRRFWALVARYCPDYKKWVKWFKLNSTKLIW